MDFIPVIDLAKIILEPNNSKPEENDWISIASEIEKALHGIGFMYLVNHGVSKDAIQKGFMHSASFFDLKSEIKEKYRKNVSQNCGGWVQAGQELLSPDSVFELRECFDFLSAEVSITETPNFYPTIEEFRNECNILIKKLLKLLGIALKLDDPEFFLKASSHLDDPRVPSECDFRSIYYPPVPEDKHVPEGTVRCAEHTDYEILTLLFQDDIGGLEVKAVNGSWVSATPIPGAILVNTGDLLEFWTNGYFPATFHRVIIPKLEIQKRTPRYSFAYFFAPDNSTLVTPLKCKILDYTSADTKVPTITAYDHIMERVKGAYQY